MADEPTRISGLDTIGVVNVGMLNAEKINLTFRATDGKDYNIFVPQAAVQPMMAALVSLNAKWLEQSSSIALGKSQPLFVDEFKLGVADDRQTVVMELKTPDAMTLTFALDATRSHLLAEGLASASGEQKNLSRS